jgi:nucleotide-binding universal stress UspA family protein
MRKILLAYDGKHFSKGAFEFARKLNEQDPVMIAGVFLPKVEYPDLWGYAGGMANPLLVPVVEDYDAEEVEKNISRFEEMCRKNGMEYRVHRDYSDFALPELKKETRFADLAIIGSESFYENLGTAEPNEYLKDALHAAECPVVVVPENFEFPESNILAYDGSESSVFAIKQFACLFPGLSLNKTLLVYAKEEGENEIPDESYIEELAARRFPDLTIMQLDIKPRKYFATWLSEKKNAILVSGSFGRSSISRIFRKSFIADVIKDHKLPVFITHC